MVPLYIGSCVLGVQAEATIRFSPFSSISTIISFWPDSVHRNALVFEITTPSRLLANSTNLSQSTFPLILIPQ